MEINGNTRLAAVVANPIRHSLSPFIHNRAFELTGENGVYLAWEVRERDLLQVLHNIRTLGMYGVNLSMPYKSLAMWYTEDLSDRARLIGAVNTIVNKNGKLTGHNTDGLGFFAALAEINSGQETFKIENQTLTVLGGGGAALAIIVEAAMQGAKEIFVFARKGKSYQPLEKKLATITALTQGKIQLQVLSDEKALQEAVKYSDLLVNATSLGMDGRSCPIPMTLQGHEKLIVADSIYKVLQTPFLKWAERQRLINVNGLGMLLHQAAESFKLWTGKKMPLGTIESELRQKIYREN